MLSDEQLRLRRTGVSASWLPAILGCDPYGRTLQEWRLGIKHDQWPTTSPAMRLGQIFEPALLGFAAEELGAPVIENRATLHHDADGVRILATPDGTVANPARAPVEAKFVMSRERAAEWGEPGTDEIPLSVTAQTMPQMFMLQAQVCYVPALVIGRDPALYQVRWDDELWRMIVERAGEAWRRYIVLDETPPDAPQCPVEIYRRIKREPGSIVQVPAEAMSEYGALRSARLEFESRAKEAKSFEDIALAGLLGLAGASETLESSAGRISLKRVTRRGYTVQPSEYTRIDYKPHRESNDDGA